MSGEKNINKLLKSMTPSMSDEDFVFCVVDINDFGELNKLQPIGTFREEEGMTVIVPKPIADQYTMAYQGVFRCISLTVHSSLEAVGLTAAFATKLSDVNISANVVAGFYHDHIFVSKKDAVDALNALNDLSNSH